MANVSLNVVLKMLLFILSSANINFLKRELWWRSYTIEEVFSTIKQVKLVRKKEFVAAAFDSGHEAFVVYVASLESPSNNQKYNLHLSCKAQIAALIANKAPTSIPTEYSDFVNIFFLKLASKLLEHTGINDPAIKLVENWQSLYEPIYSLKSVELETLKTYIKTNLANGFNKSSKSPVGASILYDKKPNGSFWLYVDYWKLNNLTIKNQYPLLLVGELLDQLG